MEIKTNKKIGETVWWVNESGEKYRIFEATIEEISLCEYQGALYCTLHCPSFKINPFPTVHYSYVFNTKEEAKDHIRELKVKKRDGFPVCDGCKYAWKGRGV